MSEFGFGFRSLLGKNPKTPKVHILDPEHQETPLWLTQGGWTPKEGEKRPKQEWTPTPKKMATQTITRLTDVPEHTLDEVLQQQGEPSTPAKGKNQTNNPDEVSGNPDTEPDPGDNYSIGGNEPPGGGTPGGGPPGGPGNEPLWQPARRTTENQHKNIPKLKHKLAKASDFAGWTKALKMCLYEYDLHPDYDYSYWDLIQGEFTRYRPAMFNFGISERLWNKATNFTMLVIRNNCEEGPHQLIRLCDTAAEAYDKLRTQYENKMVADLGVVLSGITKMEYKDSIPIETYINTFEEKWENMIVTAGGTLKESHREFRNLLLGLGRNEMAKKEFLLTTFPTHIMKYGQLVQNLRTREDYTYADMVANLKQYAPQLIWKKNEDKHKGETKSGSKENPVILRTGQQLTDRFGKPLDMNKSCGYCQNVKKWRGIGHTEQECKTKQREKEAKGNSQVKGVETLDLDDHQEGGVAVSRLFIRMLKIAGQSPNQHNNRTGWYEYDTGAQTHTTNEKWRLTNSRTYINGVQGHDGHVTKAELIGDINLPHEGKNIILRNVLYSPQFSNLISGLRSSKRVSVLEQANGKATLRIEDKTVYNMEVDPNGLWVKPDDLNRVTILKVSSAKLQELHERYGHLSFPALKKLPEAKDIPPEEFAKAECISCIKGKSTKPAAKTSDLSTRTQEVLERIHCDLIGPMETEWLGKKYVLTIIDDYSRYCIAIPIRAKSDTTETLKQAIKEMQLATGGRKVKAIQADWGGEFKNGALNSWCKSKGIIQKETVAYHSETNAVVERLNRTLQDITRTAMIGAELKGLWGDAVKWAAYTKNRIPHENLTGMTPAQIFLLKEVPTRSNLRPFGQRVMIHIYKDQRDGRWAPRAQEARIIGYTETHGVYQVITPTGKRLISKNPRPIKELPEEPSPPKEVSPNVPSSEKITPIRETPKEPRRSTRANRDNRPFNQRENEGLYGTPQVSKLRLLVNRVGHDDDHPTEEQADLSPNAKEWEEAREKERQKLRKYGVYSVVPKIPNGHRPVDTKWVYDVKRDKEGNLLRRRARKVGRGFTQEYGKTYEDTYSQMARSETWRTLLALAIQYNWHVHQWDVVAAYLNAPLTHEVYVKDGEECWRLHKALYGLKQAGHEWYNTLRDIMTKSGLQQSIGDPGVFFKKGSIIIATHVDDMAAFAPEEKVIITTEAAIEQHVELEKLGIPAKLLGMELTWGSGYVKLTQQTAIGNLAKEFGITTIIPTKSLPLNANDYAETQEETNPELHKKYQSLVGSLLYIARHTRPEISLHINLLGRRTSKPTQLHFQTAIRILRYLSSSSTDGISLRKESLEATEDENINIQGYADASYGGEKSLSQSGSLIKLNTQVVSWTSRRQETTAQSITEAEYIACSETAKDLRWVQQLMMELGMTPVVKLYTDNEAAIKLTKTQTFHRRTRHVEHKWHFIRELVDRKLLTVQGIAGKENPADILTKLTPMNTVNQWKRKECGM